MSDVAIEIDATTGEVFAVIAGKKRGKEVKRRYHIEKAPPGLDDRAWWVTAVDAGKAWRTGIDRMGVLRCNCPDAKYRGRGRDCKHARAVQALLHMLESLK